MKNAERDGEFCITCRPVKSYPPCRVLRSFEPAKAGRVLPLKNRLGRSLSRTSSELRTHFVGVGSKPVMQHHAHGRLKFLYHVLDKMCRDYGLPSCSFFGFR